MVQRAVAQRPHRREPGGPAAPSAGERRRGVVVTVHGRPLRRRFHSSPTATIVEIDAIADPDCVRRIGATILTDE
jgi:hypothetical protein